MATLRGEIGEVIAGQDALSKGDASRAREHFRRAADAGRADAVVWLGLAAACTQLGDIDGTVEALDRMLVLEPRNCRALIMRADAAAKKGDRRLAAAYYGAAIKYAPAPQRQSPSEAAEFARAQNARANLALQFERQLREALAAYGYDQETSSRRFAQSLDLMMGHKKIYFQEPRQYFFPELPQIQFYDTSMFAWAGAVEAATDAMAVELGPFLNDESVFQPYVERIPNRPRRDHDEMTESRDWTAFYLWKNGSLVKENAERFPETLRALADVPLCRIEARTPSIFFSRLRGGAHIPPHHGFINARLICHLPLVVPEGCAFRVGNEVRDWKKGKLWIFDDTIEHEAWNRSRETRVVLIFEIWRPELNEEERRLVGGMLKAIEAISGERVEWNA